MGKFICGALMGLITGMLFATMINSEVTKPTIKMAKDNAKKISECQEHLPRDKFCHLIAIPKE